MSTVGKYEIVAELGAGSMGIVYRARDPILDREVALKVLQAGPMMVQTEMRERFQREARAYARLRHPNIVTVYDLGETDGMAYIAMELLDGMDWRRAIRDARAFPIETRIELMAQVCGGLAHAHNNGIVHRDIKPSNLFIASGLHAKILDFGIARLPMSSLTRTGRILGTPNYMAPEQILGQKCEPRSDLFSAAIVFFEFLSGVHPFRAPFMPRRISEGAPELLSDHMPSLPARLGLVFAKALEKDPALRYQTGDEFSVALREAAEQARGTGPGQPEAGDADADSSSESSTQTLHGFVKDGASGPNSV